MIGYLPLINNVPTGEVIALGAAFVLLGAIGRLLSIITIVLLLLFYLVPFLNGELTKIDKHAIYSGLFIAVLSWIFGTKIGKGNAGSLGNTSMTSGSRKCPNCNGEGGWNGKHIGILGEDDVVWMTCYTCNGKGFTS